MIWGDEADWDEAETRYWYRKFYTETRTGQLMLCVPTIRGCSTTSAPDQM